MSIPRKQGVALGLFAMTLMTLALGRGDDTDPAAGAQQLAAAAAPLWLAHELRDVRERLQQKGGPYLTFLERSTMHMGLYRLPAGTTDQQTPHGQDEVYYVVEGKARFTVAGSTRDVSPGGILFVQAEVEHRFHDITEDLELLVFFSTAPVREPSPGHAARDQDPAHDAER